MNRYLVLVLFAAIIYGGRQALRHREFSQPDGILVSQEPKQKLLPVDARPIMYKGNVLQPLAEYQIRARLIRQESYLFDNAAKVSSLDLCVGWGALSDNKVIDKIRFSQTNRFCFYGWDNPAPVDPQVIMKSMANIHIIPENDAVKDIMNDLRPGQIVNLSGYLVRVDYRDGGEWKSSLSREDTGNGACEVMLVKSLYVDM
jgi:hypothetical protein